MRWRVRLAALAVVLVMIGIVDGALDLFFVYGHWLSDTGASRCSTFDEKDFGPPAHDCTVAYLHGEIGWTDLVVVPGIAVLIIAVNLIRNAAIKRRTT